jgi:hypothetical protein
VSPWCAVAAPSGRCWSLLLLSTLAFSPDAGAQEPAERPTARIAGRVIDEAGVPLRDAIAVLDGTRYRQTDAGGRFQFDSLSAGTHRLDVRSIGYSPLTATLKLAPGTADVVVTLQAGVRLLPEISVRARRPHLEEVGFYRRRAEENGRFVEADSIFRLDSLDLRRGLSRLPGFRERFPAASDPDVASHACRDGFQLWVNGWEIDSADKAFYLRTLHPGDLDGVEIYEDATAPQVFTRHLPRACVLAIWER